MRILHSSKVYKSIAILLVLFLMVCLAEDIFSAKKGKTVSQQEDISAVITQIIGKVGVLRFGKTNWLKAEIGNFLYEGDKIKTEVQSKAVLVFANGTQLKIDQNTEFEIDKKEVKDNQLRERIRIKKGKAFFGTRAKAQKSSFAIRTPVAVVSIRGTQGIVNVLDENETDIYIFEGQVDVENEYGKVEVKKGQKTKVGAGEPPQDPEKIEEKEMKQETSWHEELKTEIKGLEINIKNEKGEEKTLRLRFEK